MKAKELANKLLQYPDFEVWFCYMEADESRYGISLHYFEGVDIVDIGHSDKNIILGGEEE